MMRATKIGVDAVMSTSVYNARMVFTKSYLKSVRI